jgi:hypothetical protein
VTAKHDSESSSLIGMRFIWILRGLGGPGVDEGRGRKW